MNRILKIAVVLSILGLLRAGHSQEFTFKADLDPFIQLPGAYSLNPESLATMFKKGDMRQNPYFEWLNKKKTRAIFKRRPASNVEVDLTILDGKVPVQEMIVDFRDGEFLGVTMSIFNRGDALKISRTEFDRQKKAVGKHLAQQLAARTRVREGSIKRGILTSAYSWISARGMGIVEWNPSADEGQDVEFLRMRLCRRDATGSYAAAMNDRTSASVRKSKLPDNVVKSDDGDIYISNIPMVDQGGKGYCVVASVQRLFEYYGAPCDMHQLAEIANADPNRGTNTIETNNQLSAIDHLFRMRYECLGIFYNGRMIEPKAERGRLLATNDEIDVDDFKKLVERHVNAGLPLLWSLEVGRYPEEPPLHEQTSGGHMRLIIGYNDSENRLLFSDSWGAGHENKSMDLGDAFRATHGVFSMEPTVN